MQAFNNDPQLQADLIYRAEQHKALDEYIHGSYGGDNSRRGCAVGCTIMDIAAINNTHLNTWHHKSYELIGIPERIACIEDFIFETMSNGYANWPVEFLRAINLGSDLSDVTGIFVNHAADQYPELFRMSKQDLLDMFSDSYSYKTKAFDIYADTNDDQNEWMRNTFLGLLKECTQ